MYLLTKRLQKNFGDNVTPEFLIPFRNSDRSLPPKPHCRCWIFNETISCDRNSLFQEIWICLWWPYFYRTCVSIYAMSNNKFWKLLMKYSGLKLLVKCKGHIVHYTTSIHTNNITRFCIPLTTDKFEEKEYRWKTNRVLSNGYRNNAINELTKRHINLDKTKITLVL